jgi:hypothetical protein
MPETAKTKVVRLVLLIVNVLSLCIGLAISALGTYHRLQIQENVQVESLANITLDANVTAVAGNSTNSSVGAAAGLFVYDWLLAIGVVTSLTSMMGLWGSCWTNKHTHRRLGIMMLYHWILVLVSATCVWLGVLCLMFASRSDAYIDQYWEFVRDGFPPELEEQDAVEIIKKQLTAAGTLGIIVSILLVLGLYCSAHLIGHRYLTKNYLMWMNGISLMAGAVLCATGLIVANEKLGGEWLAKLVSGLGGVVFILACTGMYGARSESTKVLLLFFVLMVLIVLAIVGCIVTAFTYADPQWIRDNWNTLEKKVYPLPLDDAISIVNTNFATLGVTASICAILLLLNVWASWHLRKRINREGRFFEPLEPEEEMEERWKKNP